MKNTEYNGWKNRSTWNVALFLNNDEYLYSQAVEYMKGQTNLRKSFYKLFIHKMGLSQEKTPDGIKWRSNRLDYRRLNEVMAELGDQK